MTIRAVFFDMGGTIETFWYTPELRLRATPELRQRLHEAGIDLPHDDRQLYEVINNGWESYHKQSIITMQELPPERVWREFIFPGYPVDKEKLAAAAEELMILLELNFFQRQIRPEVPGVLEEIRGSGYKLGLISNVCSQGQVIRSLKAYGLLDYFDPVVLSSQYGRRKPDPAIFHYAARLAHVPTSQCLYVGDRIARDIVGARRAGYKYAVQIVNEFDHGEKDEGAKSDAVIHRMTGLLDFIQTHKTDRRFETGRSRRIRALLFDAGDILYFRPNRGQHFKTFLDKVGVIERDLPTEEENNLKAQAYHGQIPQDQYREGLLQLYGVTEPLLVEAGKEALEKDENNIEVFPGVPETLRQLKNAGFLLAVVTDTAVPIHVKLAWFEKGGFGDIWDSVISSREIGVQKPDRVIFQAALEQLGVAKEEAAFIGHSPEELEGARVLGMKTIAFNCDEQVQADLYIEKFEDLLEASILQMEASKTGAFVE
jgi:putative hydrolase of the HAD superfamily